MDENELKKLLEDFNKTANEIVKLENKRLEQDEMKNKREHTTRRIVSICITIIIGLWIIGYYLVPPVHNYQRIDDLDNGIAIQQNNN